MKFLSKLSKKAIQFYNLITHFPPWGYGVFYAFLIPLFACVFYINQGFNKTLGSVDALYFSTITITTLGYGEIHPIADSMKLLTAVEVVIGIFTIGLFLSALAHSRSTQLANEEAERQEKRISQNAMAGVKKHTLLITPLIEFYLQLCTKISRKTGDETATFNKNFNISTLSKIFGPTWFINISTRKKCIEVYYETIKELKEEFEKLLISVDLGYYPNLQKNVTQWLEFYKMYDFSDTMLEKPEKLAGRQWLIEKEKEMLSDFKGEVRIVGEAILNPYFALYLQLHQLSPLSHTILMELGNISKQKK